jgi:hypothetical protein
VAEAKDEEKRKRDEGKPKRLPTVSLTLVSFAVTRKAYERITQRFAKEYEAATGQPVRFRLSFGGSGTQACQHPLLKRACPETFTMERVAWERGFDCCINSQRWRADAALAHEGRPCEYMRMPVLQARAVCDGLPGDIVALALPLDVDKIREVGLINPGWQSRLPNNSVVAESVVALVTRKGNPKNIKGWDDLTRCHPPRLLCTVPPVSNISHPGVEGHGTATVLASSRRWL